MIPILHTVHPNKYAHGWCMVVVIGTNRFLSIYCRLTFTGTAKIIGCANEASPKIIGKCIYWIHKRCNQNQNRRKTKLYVYIISYSAAKNIRNGVRRRLSGQSHWLDLHLAEVTVNVTASHITTNQLIVQQIIQIYNHKMSLFRITGPVLGKILYVWASSWFTVIDRLCTNVRHYLTKLICPLLQDISTFIYRFVIIAASMTQIFKISMYVA